MTPNLLVNLCILVLDEVRFEQFICHLHCVMWIVMFSITVHRCVQVNFVAGAAYFFLCYRIPSSLAMNIRKFPYQNEYHIHHKYNFRNNVGFLAEKHELLIKKNLPASLPDWLCA